MAKERSSDQTLLAVSLSKDLFALVDEARVPLDETRSSFVRKAIVDRLKSLGYKINPLSATVPDRTAKVKRSLDDERFERAIDEIKAIQANRRGVVGHKPRRSASI